MSKQNKTRRRRPNYIVTTRGLSGVDTTECQTEKEVWEALGRASFGALTSVDSPTGKDVSKFVPR